MPRLYLAALTHPGASPAHDTFTGLPAELAEPLAAPLLLSLTKKQEKLLTLRANPDTATLAAEAAPGVLHFFRLADATLKPLPPTPPALTVQRGDAYIALSPGVHALTDSPTVARFLHLRDYFNAARLAQATLEHLLAGRAEPAPEDVTVIVIEAR